MHLKNALNPLVSYVYTDGNEVEHCNLDIINNVRLKKTN